MTFEDDLSEDARTLLRRAKSADEPQRADIALVLHGFAERVFEARAPVKRPSARKPFAFALAALALTASIGAFAKWGESWIPSFIADPPAADTAPDGPVPAGAKAVGSRRKAATKEPTPEVADSAPMAAAEPLPTAIFEVLEPVRPEAVVELGAAVESGAAVQPGTAVSSGAAVRPSASAPGLAAELDLISRARDALSSGKYAEARSLGERHARAYPRGVLGHERSAILALAQCRDARGNALAKSFIARWPDSPFAAVVLRDCALLNPQPEPPSGPTSPSAGTNVVP